jgi:hypothetical protein
MCDISLPTILCKGRAMFPIFFEHSKVPQLLSKFAPIEIGGISFFVFVWTKYSATEVLKRHETTHYLQQKEMLFVFQWLAYISMSVILTIWHRSTYLGYRKNCFEIEAYKHQHDPSYNSTRGVMAWIKYIPESFRRDN